jgi:drug/metabolite transporter (DMT)-like permease
VAAGSRRTIIDTGQISRMSKLCPGNLNLVRYLRKKAYEIKIPGTQFCFLLICPVSILPFLWEARLESPRPFPHWVIMIMVMIMVMVMVMVTVMVMVMRMTLRR